jgi:hypothetical protein
MLSEKKKDDLESEVRRSVCFNSKKEDWVLTMARLVEESGTRAMNLVKAKETELHLVCDALLCATHFSSTS